MTPGNIASASTDYVIGALPPAVIAIVRDILRSPPPDNPYDTPKAELIRRTTESEQRRLQQLLTAEELGHRKPTELLRRMRHLIGDNPAALDASILRELFLQRLPQQVRMILSVSSTETLDSLAQMADKIMDVRDDRLDRLLQANEELNRKVDQLAAELSLLKADHRRTTSRQRRQSRERSPRSPVFARARRLAPDRYKIARQEFEQCLTRIRPPFFRCLVLTRHRKPLPGCVIPLVWDTWSQTLR
ncbi:uncharacterized protein LOC119385410 [Rhipicephalus sanguineus]|uniref:uncharacterized protein LOC119385410 n=1 Tax=Rhipicephalus sanguineus TaxID=34632 RepID=UPI0018949CB9|nr:uncharacterized protein LOC119385410 [Rhipicephalus sanguineus]